MRKRLLVSLFVLGFASMGAACGGDEGEEGPNYDRFIGAYTGSVTLSGAGSQTYTADIQIQRGSSADLIVSFLDVRNLRATITGSSSFRIDDQQTNLTDERGEAFAVTISGNGSVAGTGLSITGQFSSNTGVVTYTVTGNKI